MGKALSHSQGYLGNHGLKLLRLRSERLVTGAVSFLYRPTDMYHMVMDMICGHIILVLHLPFWSPRSPGSLSVSLLRIEELRDSALRWRKWNEKGAILLLITQSRACSYHGTRPASGCCTHSFLACFLQNFLVRSFPQTQIPIIPQNSACVKDILMFSAVTPIGKLKMAPGSISGVHYRVI